MYSNVAINAQHSGSPDRRCLPGPSEAGGYEFDIITNVTELTKF